jgi:hypothetical protein
MQKASNGQAKEKKNGSDNEKFHRLSLDELRGECKERNIQKSRDLRGILFLA